MSSWAFGYLAVLLFGAAGSIGPVEPVAQALLRHMAQGARDAKPGDWISYRTDAGGGRVSFWRLSAVGAETDSRGRDSLWIEVELGHHEDLRAPLLQMKMLVAREKGLSSEGVTQLFVAVGADPPQEISPDQLNAIWHSLPGARRVRNELRSEEKPRIMGAGDPPRVPAIRRAEPRFGDEPRTSNLGAEPRPGDEPGTSPIRTEVPSADEIIRPGNEVLGEVIDCYVSPVHITVDHFPIHSEFPSGEEIIRSGNEARLMTRAGTLPAIPIEIYHHGSLVERIWVSYRLPLLGLAKLEIPAIGHAMEVTGFGDDATPRMILPERVAPKIRLDRQAASGEP